METIETMETSLDNKLSIDNELEKTINNFINEIDIGFDYIDKKIISKLQKFIKLFSKDSSESKMNKINEIFTNLKVYENDLVYITITKNKLKTSDFDFMNNIILFDIIHFELFKNENKNTKRTLINYLYNIYMSCFFLHIGLNGSINDNNLNHFINNLQNKLKIHNEQIKFTPKKNKKKSIQNSKLKSNSSSIPNTDNVGNTSNTSNTFNPNNIANMAKSFNMSDPNSELQKMMRGYLSQNVYKMFNNDNEDDVDDEDKKITPDFINNQFGDIIKNLMSNGEIMNIATELSKDIQNENIDPMILLSSLMSGKSNDKIEKLIQNISVKIEDKINKGDINEELLKKETDNIFNSFDSLKDSFKDSLKQNVDVD